MASVSALNGGGGGGGSGGGSGGVVLFQRSLKDMISGLRSSSMSSVGLSGGGGGGGGSSGGSLFGSRSSSASSEPAPWAQLPPAVIKFLDVCLSEIRKEIRDSDIRTKTCAVEKLFYLHMTGRTDMSWAAFHVVEVIAQPQNAYYGSSTSGQPSSSQTIRKLGWGVTNKRIGYLAACSSFHAETDVMLLITNLIKKDLASPSVVEQAMALDALATVATPDLARDLVADVFELLSSQTSGQLRRRAAVCLHKLVMQYPDALRPSFPRLVERLEDDDVGTVGAVVGVICELASSHPASYLPLAPTLFRLLTDGYPNGPAWTTIKLVRTFATLAPHEPRLGKKLAPPILNMLATTTSKALLFDCIRLCATGLTSHEDVVRACTAALKKNFLSAGSYGDQNLRYLGLSLLELFLQHGMPAVVVEHQSEVLRCLEDDTDRSMAKRALALVRGMTNKNNAQQTCEALLGRAESRTISPDFRCDVVNCVLAMSSESRYFLVDDFNKYVTLLCDLARVKGAPESGEVGRQLVDVVSRVEACHETAARCCLGLLEDSRLLDREVDSDDGDSAAKGSPDAAHDGDGCDSFSVTACGGAAVATAAPRASRALAGAAWVVGEYAVKVLSAESSPTPAERAAMALLQPSVANLPASSKRAFLNAVMKVLAACASKVVTKASVLHGSASDLCAVATLGHAHVSAIVKGCTDVECHELACRIKRISAVLLGEEKDDGDDAATKSDASGVDAASRARALESAVSSGEGEVYALVRALALIADAEVVAVASRAQQAKVTPAEGLDVSAPFGELAELEGFEVEEKAAAADELQRKDAKQLAASDAAHRKSLARHRRRHEAFYLGGGSSGGSSSSLDKQPDEHQQPTKENVAADEAVKRSTSPSIDWGASGATTGDGGNSAPSPSARPRFDDDDDGDGGDGRSSKDVEGAAAAALAQIDLSRPLAANEQLPQVAAYAGPLVVSPNMGFGGMPNVATGGGMNDGFGDVSDNVDAASAPTGEKRRRRRKKKDKDAAAVEEDQ